MTDGNFTNRFNPDATGKPNVKMADPAEPSAFSPTPVPSSSTVETHPGPKYHVEPFSQKEYEEKLQSSPDYRISMLANVLGRVAWLEREDQRNVKSSSSPHSGRVEKRKLGSHQNDGSVPVDELESFKNELSWAQETLKRCEHDKRTLAKEIKEAKECHEKHLEALRECVRDSETERDNARLDLEAVRSELHLIPSLKSEIASRKQELEVIGYEKYEAEKKLKIYRQKTSGIIETLERQTQSLQDQNGKLMKQIATLSSNPHKVADDTFQQQWRQLAYNISNLVETLLIQPSASIIYARVVDSRFAAVMRQKVADFTTCFRDHNLRSFLLQAYVWQEIHRVVFSKMPQIPNIWGGQAGGQFRAVFKTLSDTLPSKFQNLVAAWRAEGAAALESSVGGRYCDNTVCSELAQNLQQELCEFLPEQGYKEFSVKLQDQLMEVIGLSFEILSMFMKSKATFTIDFPEPPRGSGDLSFEYLFGVLLPLRFEPETMSCLENMEETGSGTRVVIVVSPMLLKTGSADGMGYDTTQIIAQAGVVCD